MTKGELMKKNDTKSQNNAKDLKIQEENLTTEYSQKTARGEKDILQSQYAPTRFLILCKAF